MDRHVDAIDYLPMALFVLPVYAAFRNSLSRNPGEGTDDPLTATRDFAQQLMSVADEPEMLLRSVIESTYFCEMLPISRIGRLARELATLRRLVVDYNSMLEAFDVRLTRYSTLGMSAMVIQVRRQMRLVRHEVSRACLDMVHIARELFPLVDQCISPASRLLTEDEFKWYVTTVEGAPGEATQCPICLEPVEGTHSRLACGHVGHTSCFHQLMTQSGQRACCPNCRAFVRPDSVGGATRVPLPV